MVTKFPLNRDKIRNYNVTLVNQHDCINTFDVEFTIIMKNLSLKFQSMYYGWEWVHRQWLIALGGLRLKKKSESLLYIIYKNSPVNWEFRLIGTKCLEPMCPN